MAQVAPFACFIGFFLRLLRKLYTAAKGWTELDAGYLVLLSVTHTVLLIHVLRKK